MNEIVVIEGTRLDRVAWQGRPAVTLAMIARTHHKQSDDVWKNFDRNRERFIEGEDYVVLPYEEWSSLVPPQRGNQKGTESSPKRGSLKPPQRGSQNGGEKAPQGGYRGDSYLFFDSGYLMLVKTFTDDLSWRVQRALVRHYFSSEREIALFRGTVQMLQGKLIESLEDANMYKRLYIDHIERKPLKPMTDYERRQIIIMKSQDKTTAKIKEKTAWSSSTINKVVRKAREAGELPPMPWSEKIKMIHLHPEFLEEVR